VETKNPVKADKAMRPVKLDQAAYPCEAGWSWVSWRWKKKRILTLEDEAYPGFVFNKITQIFICYVLFRDKLDVAEVPVTLG